MLESRSLIPFCAIMSSLLLLVAAVVSTWIRLRNRFNENDPSSSSNASPLCVYDNSEFRLSAEQTEVLKTENAAISRNVLRMPREIQSVSELVDNSSATLPTVYPCHVFLEEEVDNDSGPRGEYASVAIATVDNVNIANPMSFEDRRRRHFEEYSAHDQSSPKNIRHC